ncbi:putative MFS family arabinose efflux permease [Tamaricihabitans halophyticus]|uniref:Putative MFS family arabinose efflux permease n=1 Tax=Tamaricihabitans halophyticus TaxID=1262583 RepID=A0A4R2QH51_9PSEU|nr:MFS transporter [Tamaricihabitans halophyticus]TCP47904.1 putative MFS family arabinose efflux permease [Tamaricihabitans halophyticus]
MSLAESEQINAGRDQRGTGGVLLSVGLLVTVCVMPVFLVGGLGVQLRAELGLTEALLGAAASIFFAAGAVSARPFAAVTERVGPTIAMRSAALGSALCLFGLAAVPNAGWLLGVIALAGVTNSLCQPASNELLMRRVKPDRRGFAFAVKQAAIPAATLSAGLAVPAIALTIGWRWVFAIAGLLALLSAVCVPRLRWTRPKARVRNSGGSTGVLLTLLSIAAGFGAAAANAMGAFVTLTAVEVGYEEGNAGLMLALGSAAGLASRLGAGALADRRKPNLLRMVTTMVIVGSIGFLLLAFGQPVLFLVGLVLGFGFGWAWQGVFNFAVAARFPDRVATATAVTQTGVFIGGALGPIIFGVLASTQGVPAAWLSAFGMMALTAVALLLAGRR